MRNKLTSARVFVIFLGLFWAVFTGPAHAAFSGGGNGKEAPSAANDDMDALLRQSEFVVLAHVLEIKQELSKTRVKLAVDEVYKGVPEAPEFWLEHAGGKHTVALDEPSFLSYDKAILYLRKDPQGTWRCVDGARGKKQLLNDHVYVEPGNGFASVDFKKYRGELRKKVSSAS